MPSQLSSVVPLVAVTVTPVLIRCQPWSRPPQKYARRPSTDPAGAFTRMCSTSWMPLPFGLITAGP